MDNFLKEYWCWYKQRYCPYADSLSGRCTTNQFIFDDCFPNSYNTNTTITEEHLLDTFLYKYNEDYYEY